MKFFVRGPLPDLNKMLSAAKIELPWLRKGKRRVYRYTLMKKKWTGRVMNACLFEFNKHKRGMPKPVTVQVQILCQWVEPDNKRDIDNIEAAIKFILDGLKKAKVIPDDSRRWVPKVTHEHLPNDPTNAGVYVSILRA